MDILTVLKLVSAFLSLGVVIWGWRQLPGRQSQRLFATMIGLFFLSTVLFFPEGDINDWLKHLPFYMGQLTFYLFLRQLIKDIKIPDRPDTQPGQPMAAMIALGTPVITDTPITSNNWFHFITEQGIQHIITLPLLFVIIAFTSSEYMTINRPELKAGLNWLMMAALSLVMIHIGEFIVESQAWLPMLEGNSIEIIEFMWYYLAIGLFAFSIAKLQPLLKLK